MERKIVSNEKGSNQYKKVVVSHNETQPKTRTDERIASEYGLNRATVGRDYQFARAVDILPAETKQKIISGDLPVSKKEMMDLDRMDAATKNKVVKAVQSGVPVSKAIVDVSASV
ncbi:MAG: hypothetical protein AB2L20_01000 [Mangrovibacterium sp.]